MDKSQEIVRITLCTCYDQLGHPAFYVGSIKVQGLYLEFHAYQTVVLLAVNILVGFFRKYFKMYCIQYAHVL